jgi:hypothetical protein
MTYFTLKSTPTTGAVSGFPTPALSREFINPGKTQMLQ